MSAQLYTVWMRMYDDIWWPTKVTDVTQAEAELTASTRMLETEFEFKVLPVGVTPPRTNHDR